MSDTSNPQSKAFTERLDTLLTLFYYGEPMNGGEYPKEQFDRMKQDSVIKTAHSEILALVADEIIGEDEPNATIGHIDMTTDKVKYRNQLRATQKKKLGI